MASIVEIFNGSTIAGGITSSSMFVNASGVFLEATGAISDFEVDAYLQVFFGAIGQRNIPWILPQDTASTVAVLPIDHSCYGFPMRVDLLASEAIPCKIWAIVADCECQAKLNEIDAKLNLLLVGNFFTQILRLVGVLIGGGVPREILPPFPGKRKFILPNPLSERVFVGLNRPASVTDYDWEILPGSSLELEFSGQVTAITELGSTYTTDIRVLTS
jgi:hypothetical protein